jgi:hypothetical protein
VVEGVASFVAECFWPDVETADLEALDRRVRDVEARLRRERREVRYLGSLLMREDEVVLCHFEGTAADVREVAERSRIPFERIVEVVGVAASPPPSEPGSERSGREES